MLRFGLKSLLFSGSRGFRTAPAATALNEAGVEIGERAPRRRSKPWPVDNRGEEIRTAKGRRMGISTSDKKLNLVAKLVRGLSITEAERQLFGCKKRHTTVVWETIQAALVNARYFNLREDRLVVDRAFVGRGKYIKKIRPWHGKGRWGVEHKKYCHLTVILRELDEELWEASVMPQYVHLRYRKDKERLDDADHPVHQSEKVSFHSQLDVSLRQTNERIAGLQTLIQNQDMAGTGANGMPTDKQ